MAEISGTWTMNATMAVVPMTATIAAPFVGWDACASSGVPYIPSAAFDAGVGAEAALEEDAPILLPLLPVRPPTTDELVRNVQVEHLSLEGRGSATTTALPYLDQTDGGVPPEAEGADRFSIGDPRPHVPQAGQLEAAGFFRRIFRWHRGGDESPGQRSISRDESTNEMLVALERSLGREGVAGALRQLASLKSPEPGEGIVQMLSALKVSLGEEGMARALRRLADLDVSPGTAPVPAVPDIGLELLRAAACGGDRRALTRLSGLAREDDAALLLLVRAAFDHRVLMFDYRTLLSPPDIAAAVAEAIKVRARARGFGERQPVDAAQVEALIPNVSAFFRDAWEKEADARALWLQLLLKKGGIELSRDEVDLDRLVHFASRDDDDDVGDALIEASRQGISGAMLRLAEFAEDESRPSWTRAYSEILGWFVEGGPAEAFVREAISTGHGPSGEVFEHLVSDLRENLLPPRFLIEAFFAEGEFLRPVWAVKFLRRGIEGEPNIAAAARRSSKAIREWKEKLRLKLATGGALSEAEAGILVALDCIAPEPWMIKAFSSSSVQLIIRDVLGPEEEWHWPA